MALPDQPQRQYVNTAQLLVVAPDPATAQATLEAAVRVANAAMSGVGEVALEPEVENGLYVLSET